MRADHGTLYQLRNLLNRRNVRVKPKSDVNTHEGFFLEVVEGLILAATMKVLKMMSPDDDISEDIMRRLTIDAHEDEESDTP